MNLKTEILKVGQMSQDDSMIKKDIHRLWMCPGTSLSLEDTLDTCTSLPGILWLRSSLSPFPEFHRTTETFTSVIRSEMSICFHHLENITRKGIDDDFKNGPDYCMQRVLWDSRLLRQFLKVIFINKAIHFLSVNSLGETRR